jgi:hypothetical protein
MATKFCIFCGKHPEGKNKEHVIPEWLIELTGDPNRKARFGFDLRSDPPKWREFSFDSLTFPACAKCNNDFSNLESKAKVVIESVLGHQPLSELQLCVLLDWLDKVRVGLWLGYLYLDGNPQSIRPQYHIATRIGQTDRTLGILRIRNKSRGINFCGPESPCFQNQPTCFALIVNDICFYNVAGLSLCSRRLGFPHITPKHLRDDGKLEVVVSGGTERLIRPVIRNLTVPQMTLFHQANLPQWFTTDRESNLFYTEWVKTRSLDWKGGHGGVFVEREGVVYRYPKEPTLDWLPGEARDLYETNRIIASLVYDRLIDDLEMGARLSSKQRFKHMMWVSAQSKQVHNAVLTLMTPRRGKN